MDSRKTSLIRRWAHAPWHSWLKTEPEWLEVFAELWARIPEEEMAQLFTATRPLVVLPPVETGRVVRVRGPLLAGVHILQLDSRLLARPRKQAVAILAHELAHLCVRAQNDELTNDLEADRLVLAWGFGEGLLDALKTDLEAEHPRVRAAASGVPAKGVA